MVAEQKGEMLRQTGPDTPAGQLLRRYWHPIAAASELAERRPTKRVRLLGENLVVYRALDGSYGLFDEPCVHLGHSLYYGEPEADGFRCRFHGWLFDKTGTVLQTPPDAREMVVQDALRQRAYIVEKTGGLLFAYLGPTPAPSLPAWDALARRDGTRKIEIYPALAWNWLQVQEWGIRTFGALVDSDDARGQGDTMIFPNVLRHSGAGGSIELFFRVPVDDEHTRTIWLGFEPSPDGPTVVEDEDPSCAVYLTLKDAEDFFYAKSFPSQDSTGTPGPLRERVLQHLGMADAGVTRWRQLLSENIERVQRGEDPAGVHYEPDSKP